MQEEKEVGGGDGAGFAIRALQDNGWWRPPGCGGDGAGDSL